MCVCVCVCVWRCVDDTIFPPPPPPPPPPHHHHHHHQGLPTTGIPWSLSRHTSL